MKSTQLASAIACAFLLISNASAADLVSTSFTVGFGDTRSTAPAAGLKSTSSSGALSLTYALEDAWLVTGVAALSTSKVTLSSDDSRKNAEAIAGGVVGTKTLKAGMAMNISALYGDVKVNSTPLSGSDFSSKANSLNLGIGLVQAVVTGKASMASFSANLAYTDSDGDAYTDGTGNVVAGNANQQTKLTLGASHSWLLGEWRPSANLSYTFASREATPDSGDKDYFNWGFGVTKQLAGNSSIGLSFSTVANKQYAKEDYLSISYVRGF
jgi:hypothetical protein